MKPLPHVYNVHLTGSAAGASVSSKGLPDLRTAPPADYDGPGDTWSPEHLLLASIESCFLFTWRAIARASRVDFEALTVDAEGTVDRQDGITRFTTITLRPLLTVPAGADRELALRALAKTEKACLISTSISTPIHLEPQITEAPELVSVASHVS